MPITGDLINLDNLVLTDTFNTWLNRTNQLVDSLNPLQVYDVIVGTGPNQTDTGGGIAKYAGENGGVYNGIVSLAVNPGPGIAVVSLSGESRTLVDFRYFDDYGYALSGTGTSASINRVAAIDEYIVNDTSDTSSGPEGTAKKIKAKNMLPPVVEMDVLTISGNVVVLGNLSTYGTSDFIAANNLVIEDKQIELAYQQAVILGVTGVSASSFPLTGGATAYYFSGPLTITANFYGHLQSFTAGNPAGPTGVFYLGALFQNPYGVEDVGATGFISLSSTGSTSFYIYQNNGITSAFLSNDTLSDGGISLKSSAGDKKWVWVWQDLDTGKYYNSWQSNSNIGVDGKDDGVISRIYRSYGFTGINQSEFIVTAETNKNAEIYLAEINNELAPLTFTGGSWKISKRSTDNYLVFSTGTTGISSVSESFIITPGASGVTYSGISINNFAKNLNVDMLDGANASTTSQAYTIPVADQYGRVIGDFLNADAVRRRYTQAAHGLTFGQAVRIQPNTGLFVPANASNAEVAESVGLVSAVHNANEFTVTHKGRIDGISGSLMTFEGVGFTAGNIYFLGATSVTASLGKLIYDPDSNVTTRINLSQIRKPMLLALSATAGYVLDKPGSRVSEVTDLVYLTGIAPVGSIQAYTGTTDTIPAQWLLCDGDVYYASDYPELYNIIGHNFEASLSLGSVSTSGNIVGGTRNLLAGTTIRARSSSTSTDYYTGTLASVNSTTGEVTISWTSSTPPPNFTYRFTPLRLNNFTVFFVPDMRTRSIVGANYGAGYNNANMFPFINAEFGGSETSRITSTTLPPHQHNVQTSLGSLNTGTTPFVTSISATASIPTNTSASPFSLRDPFVITHYIIRARPGSEAVILTGHNHNDVYHPLNGDMFISGPCNTPYSETVPTNAFNVIVNENVAGPGKQLRTALSVFADPVPTQQFGSNTEVHVRGDFTVFANGLTTLEITAARFGECVVVRPNISTVSIVGGTGSAFTAYRPNPVLAFVNGLPGGPPIGRITGLSLTSAITGSSTAVSKYYSDHSDKTVENVSSSNISLWSVRHANSALPAREGEGIGSSLTAENSIIQVFYANNRGGDTENSATEVYVRGDFTVWGDGLTHTDPSPVGGSTSSVGRMSRPKFAVNPRNGTIEIYGGPITTTSGGSSGYPSFGSSNYYNLYKSDPIRAYPAPRLYFVDGISGTAAGVIGGLTACRENNEAANKWYVDQKTKSPAWFNRLLTNNGGSAQRAARYTFGGIWYLAPRENYSVNASNAWGAYLEASIPRAQNGYEGITNGPLHLFASNIVEPHSITAPGQGTQTIPMLTRSQLIPIDITNREREEISREYRFRAATVSRPSTIIRDEIRLQTIKRYHYTRTPVINRAGLWAINATVTYDSNGTSQAITDPQFNSVAQLRMIKPLDPECESFRSFNNLATISGQIQDPSRAPGNFLYVQSITPVVRYAVSNKTPPMIKLPQNSDGLYTSEYAWRELSKSNSIISDYRINHIIGPGNGNYDIQYKYFWMLNVPPEYIGARLYLEMGWSVHWIMNVHIHGLWVQDYDSSISNHNWDGKSIFPNYFHYHESRQLLASYPQPSNWQTWLPSTDPNYLSDNFTGATAEGLKPTDQYVRQYP